MYELQFFLKIFLQQNLKKSGYKIHKSHLPRMGQDVVQFLRNTEVRVTDGGGWGSRGGGG